MTPTPHTTLQKHSFSYQASSARAAGHRPKNPAETRPSRCSACSARLPRRRRSSARCGSRSRVPRRQSPSPRGTPRASEPTERAQRRPAGTEVAGGWESWVWRRKGGCCVGLGGGQWLDLNETQRLVVVWLIQVT